MVPRFEPKRENLGRVGPGIIPKQEPDKQVPNVSPMLTSSILYSYTKYTSQLHFILPGCHQGRIHQEILNHSKKA